MIIKHNKNNRSFRLKIESPKNRPKKPPQKTTTRTSGKDGEPLSSYTPKASGAAISKEVKNYLFETTDLKTTTCI